MRAGWSRTKRVAAWCSCLASRVSSIMEKNLLWQSLRLSALWIICGYRTISYDEAHILAVPMPGHLPTTVCARIWGRNTDMATGTSQNRGADP